MAALAIYVGYASAIILGMPVFLVLHKFQMTSLGIYLASGFVLGLIVYESFFPGLLGVVRAFVEGRTPDIWLYLGSIWKDGEIASVIAGAAGAAAFWLIARPDRAREDLN